MKTPTINPTSDSSFTDDVARFYEATLVPLIFEPYAEDLAVRARALKPSNVLEVACGTGVVTRSLATTLPGRCEITATDPNDAMVAHAESVGTARTVSWRQADVMALPYDDESFDVVVCQFGVMFFPDRVAAYREVRRVLRPGGTFLFNVWNAIEHNEFASVLTDAVSALYPEDPPVFLARTPHGHGSPSRDRSRRLGPRVSRSASYSNSTTSAWPTTPDVPAIAYCQGTPLRNEIEVREPGGLQRATAVAAEAIRARYGTGPVEGRISAVIVRAG